MTAQVVVGLIIPSAVNQLELSRPVIFPTCCQVVVVEVVVVNEIVHTSMCIKTGSCAEVQYAHTLVPMFIDSIKLPTFVVQVGVEHIGDAVLIVSGKCGALLPRTQVNGQRWVVNSSQSKAAIWLMSLMCSFLNSGIGTVSPMTF